MVNRPTLLYFAGAIRASRADAAVYASLIRDLAQYGRLLTEHVADPQAAEHGMTDQEIYRRDMAWLARADAVVAEVTQPSLGVGYELGRAHALAKPVLCLYRVDGPCAISAMLTGNDAFCLVRYDTVEAAVAAVGRWLTKLGLAP